MSSYLVDTNVLARWAMPHDPAYPVARHAVSELVRTGGSVYITAQNLIEFRAFATRPAGPPANGLGFTATQADADCRQMKAMFGFLPDSPTIFDEWEALVSSVGALGRQVHDARLVAVMRAYGVTELLTFNDADFRRYPGITVVHPSSL